MGKLYDVLTNGDETVPPCEDNFFTWCTPGIPVGPYGLRVPQAGADRCGEDAKASRVATRQPGRGGHRSAGAALTRTELDQLRAETPADVRSKPKPGPTGRLRPDVTKVDNGQFARLNVLNNTRDAFGHLPITLRMSQVMHQTCRRRRGQKIAKLRGRPHRDQEEEEPHRRHRDGGSEPSPLVVAYHEKMRRNGAAPEYNTVGLTPWWPTTRGPSTTGR